MGKREAEPADRESKIGDMAMYAAGGGARVAKAGAYVTGGGLVATYGSTDAVRADSRNTGYESDNPTPTGKPTTVSFPDYGSEPAEHPAPPTAGRELHGPDMQAGVAGGGQGPDLTLTVRGPHNRSSHSTDSNSGGPAQPPAPPAVPTPPGLGGGTGTGLGPQLPSPGGMGASGISASGLSAPSSAADMGSSTPGLQNFATDMTHLGQTVTTLQTEMSQTPHTAYSAPGPVADSGHPIAEAGGHGDLFAGVGDANGFGAFVSTQWSADAGIGSHGIFMDSNLHVDFTIGNVSAQEAELARDLNNGIGRGLDNTVGHLGDTMDSQLNPLRTKAGMPVTGGNGGYSSTGVAPANSPTSTSESGLSASGTSGLPGFGPSGTPIGPVGGGTMAPTHTVAATTTTPATSAVSLTQPALATPLQTAVQPAAATHPIADITAHAPGPSLLTSPATLVPLLGGHPLNTTFTTPEETPSTHPTLKPIDGGSIHTGTGTTGETGTTLTPPTLLKPGVLTTNPSTAASAHPLPSTGTGTGTGIGTDGTAATHDPTLIKPGTDTPQHTETAPTHTEGSSPTLTGAPHPPLDPDTSVPTGPGSAPTGGAATGEHPTVAPGPTGHVPTASIPTHEPTVAPVPANPPEQLKPDLNGGGLSPLHPGGASVDGAGYHPADHHYAGLHATADGLSTGLTPTPLTPESDPAWHDHVVSGHHVIHPQMFFL